MNITFQSLVMTALQRIEEENLEKVATQAAHSESPPSVKERPDIKVTVMLNRKQRNRE